MDKDSNRREFITLVSGARAALAPACSPTLQASTGVVSPSQHTDGLVPRRPFGNLGVNVSKLCLGGSSVAGSDSRSLLNGALRYGIDCWELSMSPSHWNEKNGAGLTAWTWTPTLTPC